jgi:signal transduction histidine kinase
MKARRLFRNLSLRSKQTLVMMLTSCIVLFLACAAFVLFDVLTFRRELVEEVSVTADMIGKNCVAAIDFNDPRSAVETLSALQASPEIIGACIYTKDGEVLAKYDRANDDITFSPPDLVKEGHSFKGRHLVLSRPIVRQGETIGVVYLESDMRALFSRLTRYVGLMGLVFLASLVLAFGLASQLQRLVSDPILQLAKVARSVAVEKNYSVRATKESNDELGQLVEGFNEMLGQIQARDMALQAARDGLEKRVEERTQELEAIHKQLLEASRRGGMAEIATNVLHNVGNVLNSANISVGIVADSVKKSKAFRLAKVVGLLREHEQDLGTFMTSDPKGKEVPAFLAQLSAHLQAEQEATLEELVSLRGNIEHIKEIVAMQQSYATFGGVKEMINVASLVEDSMRMNEGALSRHGVEIVRDFDHVPPMNLEKHKILQIMVNLLRNAKHACQESDRVDKRLTVRLANGEGRIRISVVDNGVGIPSENLTRIFNHGFTTRKDGHGFGLHSGALAAKEMGGSLTAQSDGLGHGAAFTLELPCPPQENPPQ